MLISAIWFKHILLTPKQVKNLYNTYIYIIHISAYISYICQTIHFHLRNIGAIRNLLTDSATEQLIHSLVTSRLDYCNSLLNGVPDYKLKRAKITS